MEVGTTVYVPLIDLLYDKVTFVSDCICMGKTLGRCFSITVEAKVIIPS